MPIFNWRDGALNWDYPPDPSPWSAAERERFERAAAEVRLVLRAELGPEFEVHYEALCNVHGCGGAAWVPMLLLRCQRACG